MVRTLHLNLPHEQKNTSSHFHSFFFSTLLLLPSPSLHRIFGYDLYYFLINVHESHNKTIRVYFFFHSLLSPFPSSRARILNGNSSFI